MKPSSYYCHDLKRIILYRGHAWLLFTRPLSVLAIYQQKFLSPQLLLHFSRDIDETFQLLFPWPEDDHMLNAFNLNNFEIAFSRKLFLTIFRKIKKLICWKGCKISKHCLGYIYYWHIHHILTFHLSRSCLTDFLTKFFLGLISIGIETLWAQLLLELFWNYAYLFCMVWKCVFVVLGLSSYHTDLKVTTLYWQSHDVGGRLPPIGFYLYFVLFCISNVSHFQVICARQVKMCLRAWAKCTYSDLFCACARYHLGLWSLFIHPVVSKDFISEGLDQNVQIYRLILAFNVCICPKPHFRRARPILRLQQASLNACLEAINVNLYPYSAGNILFSFFRDNWCTLHLKLEQVDGEPSHIPAPAPSHISVHIKIPNAFLQSSSIGLSPVKVLRF